LGTAGAKMIADVFSAGMNLAGLDISDNFVREQGACAIIGSLSKNIKRLVLDYNFPAGSSNTLGGALAALIEGHAALFSISIKGQPEKRLNFEALEPFMQSLSKNSTLGELDISDNLLGDLAIAEVANSLRTNKGLLELRVDSNNGTYAAYQALRNTLNINTTLCSVPFPGVDFVKDVNANSKVPHYEEKFQETLFQIRDITAERRRKGGIHSLDLLNDFEFDKRWITPTGIPPPLKKIPEDLQVVKVKDSSLEGIDVEDPNLATRARTITNTSSLSPEKDKSKLTSSKSGTDLSKRLTERPPDEAQSTPDKAKDDKSKKGDKDDKTKKVEKAEKEKPEKGKPEKEKPETEQAEKESDEAPKDDKSKKGEDKTKKGPVCC